MERRQVQLVQQSFARAAKISPHAELFAIEPSLRALLKGDMIAQGRKLMDMLEQLVAGLDDPEAILPEAQALALRHVAYGVEAHHYAQVGAALMRTLRHELGADFTPETRTAWSAAYKLLADAMCEAAYGKDAGPTR